MRVAVSILLSLFAVIACAEQPLHQHIDVLLEQAASEQKIELSPPADDAEFVRRVHLDLIGRIPTADEARSFFANEADDKRVQLVDKLLTHPAHPQRMAEMFHVMLMERRGEDPEWASFLQHVFAENESWDAIASAILNPDAEDESRRGAAYFLTSRLVKEGAMAEVDVPGLTRDVGRLFAGVDLQCAQCHDHLDIDDYKQRDFQGLHMIFENVQQRRDTKFPAVSQNLMTAEKEYMSVFIQQQETTSPVVPGGKTIEIVTYEGDDAYVVVPDKKKKVTGVPKFNPLSELATGLTASDNRLFAKNMVNRIWHALLGRGLVEPLDLLHAENPASHPELLELLAGEFIAHEFDIRWLMREILLTKAYARTSHIPETDSPTDTSAFATAIQRRISAEQLFRSVLVATGELERHDATWNDTPVKIESIISESDELKALRDLFVKTFANPPREPELEFAPTVKAALFVMHEEKLLKLLAPRDGNLAQRLAKMDDESAMIDELFLSVLSRQPSDEDRSDVAEFLSENSDKESAISQVIWALMASTEFCVNH